MSNFVPQDDLLSLKVGSVLHHLSIKRAIQVLRLNSYEPNCLRRRPSDEVHSPENYFTGLSSLLLCLTYSFSNALLYDNIFFFLCLFSVPIEQYFSSRDFPMDQS